MAMPVENRSQQRVKLAELLIAFVVKAMVLGYWLCRLV